LALEAARHGVFREVHRSFMTLDAGPDVVERAYASLNQALGGKCRAKETILADPLTLRALRVSKMVKISGTPTYFIFKGEDLVLETNSVQALRLATDSGLATYDGDPDLG
jgi:hypothetical protein